MGKYYKNLTECDWSNGRCFIYQITTTKKNNWYVRIKRGVGAEYYVKSLKTDSMVFALQEAYKIFLKLLVSEELEIPYGVQKFIVLWKKFYRDLGCSEQRRKRVKSTYDLYFKEFFGLRSVLKINNSTFGEYLKWRLTYWEEKRKSGVKMPAYYRETPSLKTLDGERKLLIQFLHWCCQNEYLHRLPRIDLITKFSKLFGENLTVMAKKKTGQAIPNTILTVIKRKLGAYAYNNKDTNKERSLARYRLYYFVMICYGSLLRPSTELSKLKWKSVSIQRSPKYEGLYIGVIEHDHGKFKPSHPEDRTRIAITTYECVKHLVEWRAKLKELGIGTGEEDYVFPNIRGEFTETHLMGRTLQNCLKNWKLRKHDGVNITLYSIRATRITQMISDGKDIGSIATASNSSILQLSKVYHKQFMKSGKIDDWSSQYPEGQTPFAPKLKKGQTMDALISTAGFKVKK
jgi:hypothetical protein